MKVLHVSPSIEKRHGGTVTALLGMAGSQAQAGVETCVLTTSSDPTHETVQPELESEGVEVQVLQGAWAQFRRHPRLCAALQTQITSADAVHVHALWEEPQHLACRIAQRVGKPFVVSPHGMLDPWSLRQSRWKKRAYLALRTRRHLRHATGLHFTTTTERDLASSFWKKGQPIVEPLGVDLETLQSTPPADLGLRSRLGLSEGPVLLFFGRLHFKKQPEVLIDAFARVLSRLDADGGHPRPTLVFVGPAEPEYLKELEARAVSCGVADATVFAGTLTGPDRVAALQSADLFCLPSQQENFGLAVAEAIAAGTPVLISDQVNIFEEIVAGGVGWATAPDVEPFAEELHRLCVSPDAIDAAAARCEAFARQAYDWSVIAERWKAHYYSLAGGAGPRGHV